MNKEELQKIVKESFKKLQETGSVSTAKQKIRMSEAENDILSPESFDRMSGLVFTRDVQSMIKAAESMMNELTKEGFEPEEIHEFFKQLIVNDI